MSELHDPPLRLTIEGLRWMGGDELDAGSWQGMGTSGTVAFHGTDYDEDSIALLRLLRRMLVKRTEQMIAVLAVRFDALEWDAPNPPTMSDLDGLIALMDTLGDQFRALRELAPEVVDDDDDDGGDDDDPGPEPDPAPTAQAGQRAPEGSDRGWVADLRARGVKAAHPDDGWVNRDLNRIHLAYPQFNDGLGVGDLLALGYGFDGETRIVRITRGEEGGPILRVTCPGIYYWYFEAIAPGEPS